MCSISGYGESGEFSEAKAYDLLVQAESGLTSVTGSELEPIRVGVSICDIATGQAAYGAILRALIARTKSGHGAHIETSLFGVMTDWMNVPLLHQKYTHQAPKRVGLMHPSIAPYGVFSTADGKQILISIQNEREWHVFCEQVLQLPALSSHPLFSCNIDRVTNRSKLDKIIDNYFLKIDLEQVCRYLKTADIAYGRLNDLETVLAHPQLRQISVDSPSGRISLIASGTTVNGERPSALAVPAIGQHSKSIRDEFSSNV
jgi:crotonobetainyl-CoA:carnitine CoA-transferase CaiB-like acyl-CoA transferase